MLKLGTIYQTINKKNGKSYIGKTINFEKRKKQHIICAIRRNIKSYFYNAIRKYGKENFEWKILFEGECHPNKLNSLEIFFIAYYDAQKPNGYNMTNGGEGVNGDIFKGQNHPCSKKNMSREKAVLKAKKAAKTGKLRGTFKRAAKERVKKYKGKNAAWAKKGWITKRINNTVPDLSGSKNSMAKKRIFIKPNGNKYLSNGDFNKYCAKNNLCAKFIRKNINKGKIIKKQKGIGKLQKNCINWEIIET